MFYYKMTKRETSSDRTLIQTTKETAKRLKKLGNMDDSYNSVIVKLLDLYENEHK